MRASRPLPRRPRGPRIVALSRSVEKRYAQIKLRTRKPNTLAGGSRARRPRRLRAEGIRSAEGLAYGQMIQVQLSKYTREALTLVLGHHLARVVVLGALHALLLLHVPLRALDLLLGALLRRPPRLLLHLAAAQHNAQKKLSLDATCPCGTVDNTPLITYTSPRVHLAEVKSL